MSIEISNVNYIYMPGTPFEKIALDNVNLSIKDGEFLAIIGHTGSGKSTLIQNFNGLLKPTSGKIIVDGKDITLKKSKLMDIRKKVGIVFQYPEYQLFEETVLKDICFGPSKLGYSKDEVIEKAKNAMESLGLDYEKYKDLSPFELSGGQKRRVAIAGVIAMEPKTLILDEPTAGLDPKGRDDLLNRIATLHSNKGMTIILVSHSMEDVAKYASRVVVMNHGKCILDGTINEVFREKETLEEVGLALPQVTYLTLALREKGFQISKDIYTVEEAKTEVLKALRRHK